MLFPFLAGASSWQKDQYTGNTKMQSFHLNIGNKNACQQLKCAMKQKAPMETLHWHILFWNAMSDTMDLVSTVLSIQNRNKVLQNSTQ